MPPDLTLRGALLVAAGAILGALLRWGAGAYLTRDFPWGTAVVNLLGSFLIGAFLFSSFARGAGTLDARLFFAVGVLGSFTTMSSFAYDTLVMLEAGAWARAAVNVVVNPVLCLAAAYVGRLAGLAIG